MTRVLIAETDIPTRLLLQKSISQWGYQPVITQTIAEIMSELNRPGQAPALALINWKLPEIEGIALCEKIKENAILKSPYIILMLPSDSMYLGFKAIEAGASELLMKPFTLNELQARVTLGVHVAEHRQSLAVPV